MSIEGAGPSPRYLIHIIDPCGACLWSCYACILSAYRVIWKRRGRQLPRDITREIDERLMSSIRITSGGDDEAL
jgi:hypothetical protein